MALPVIGNIVKLRLGKKILNLRRYLNKKTALLFWNYSSSQWLLFVILRGAFYIIEDYSAMFLWCNSLLDRILSYVFLVGIIHVKRRIAKEIGNERVIFVQIVGKFFKHTLIWTEKSGKEEKWERDLSSVWVGLLERPLQ